MKTAIALTIGAMVATTFGQSINGLESLASCGQNCVSSMVGKASELGCNDGDYACLCLKSDFSYGVRDCSRQACEAQSDADAAQAWARAFCSGYGVAVTSSGAEILPSSTGPATSTESSGESSTTTTSTDTSTETSTETSSSTTATSTEITAPGLTSSFTTTISSGSITLTSTGVFTAPGLTTTVPPSETGDGGNNDNNNGENLARATAVPVGMMAVAGLAVFLL